MIFIVDGTGDFFDKDYQREMAGSFCRRIATHMRDKAKYFRGPSLFGFETAPTARKVTNLIIEMADKKEPVFRVGFSRGGAAVIWAAKLVARQRRIDGMFLFDAVERAVGTDCDVITNVETVYHALRDPQYAEYYQPVVNSAIKETAKNMTTFTPGFDFPTVRSGLKTAAAIASDIQHKLGPTRVWFGNAGLSKDPPQRHFPETFPCSHGAVGGTLWKAIKEDVEVSKRVWSWMASRMHQHQLFQIKAS